MNKKNKKQDDKIELDTATQEDLESLHQAVDKIQARINVILNIYIRARGKSGKYNLSKDFTCLEKVKEE